LIKKKEKKIDLKNQADSLCYQCERQLSELEDKIEIDSKNKINDKITQLRNAVTEDNYPLIRSLYSDLQSLITDFGKKSYSERSESTSKDSDKTTIDADFSETN